jgi:hypothetical protein
MDNVCICHMSRIVLMYCHHEARVGRRVLKVELEQKVLHRVMGPQSIVISHSPLVTFSEWALLLDARA